MRALTAIHERLTDNRNNGTVQATGRHDLSRPTYLQKEGIAGNRKLSDHVNRQELMSISTFKNIAPISQPIKIIIYERNGIL
jgi:hypothetical protein